MALFHVLHYFPILILSSLNLISIEFQNIKNDQGSPPKNFFFTFNCYNLVIHAITLTEIFFTKY
jgi:hypothetical protein